MFATGTFIVGLAFGGIVQSMSHDTISISQPVIMDELVVTGSRDKTDVRHLPMTVSVVERDKIERQHSPSLLPMLTEQIPGLFITSRGILGYGISGGAAGSMSIRGMGGGSARMMVLIDGHPQYMGLMGHPVADVCQSMTTERVEVLRGPASVLYGSNAMGGVINIVTRNMNEDGVRTQADIGYGSYHTSQSELSSRFRQGRFSGAAGASYTHTDGHRDDMEFDQYGGFAKLNYAFNSHWTVGGYVNVTQFKASQPGTLASPLLDADQRITRGMASLSLENEYEKASGTLNIFHNWGRHKINDGYAPSGSPLDYRFHSIDRMSGISVYQSFRLSTNSRATLGADWFHFGGKAWNKFVEGERQGERSDIVDKTQHEIAAYADFRHHFSSWLTMNAGLRLDNHTEAGAEWIPQWGAAFHLPEDTEVKLTVSKGFRYPIIREMFMWGVANPNLKAESIWNYEMALSRNFWDNRMTCGINLFYLKGDNMITVAPVDGRMMNVNTGTVENSGLEVEMSCRMSPSWSWNVNYSYLHMVHPVIASPEHKLYGNLSYIRGRWQATASVQCVDGLYTSVSPEVCENYVLLNLNGAYRMNDKLSLWLRGENLLAQRYEIMSGYPMPRATIMGGLKIQF